jgi:spore coat polysaccharide biosynthesis protein SpsF (cytidylyltransferase family)
MSTYNNIAILIARLDSARLPKKHFEKIGDDFLIDCCLNQLKKGSKYKIVLATSDRDIDKPLIDWAKERKIEVFAGNAFDIKDRIKKCVEYFKADFFARVNADSPFVNAALIDDGFTFLNLNSQFDLYTNLLTRSFPYGYAVEVFKTKSFVDTITNNLELENITSFFYSHAQQFKIKNIINESGDFSQIHLTVDTYEDLEKIRYLHRLNNKIFYLSLEELINMIKLQK